MNLDTGVAVLALLTLGNYWLSRSVLYPPFIFCAVWLIDLLLYRFNPVDMAPLHSGTLEIVTAGALLFSLGGILGILCPESLIKTKLIVTRFPPRNQLIKYLVIVFFLCSIPLLIRHVFVLASQATSGGSLFERARNVAVANAIGDEQPAFSILPYIFLWSTYASVIFLIERRDKIFWITASIALASAILTTGRMPILLVISALTGAYLLQTSRIRFWAALKTIRIPLIFFLSLYLGLIFVEKDTSFVEGGAGYIILYFLVSYIVGPLAAFDYLLLHPNEYSMVPNHTFAFFLGIATRLGWVEYHPPPSLFVAVPFPTNVYTVYENYYLEVGLVGMFAIIVLIGVLHTLLYRKALTGSELGRYFFALTLLPVVTSIFADTYASFGSYLDILLFGSIYIFLRSLPLRIFPQLRSGYGAGTASLGNPSGNSRTY